MQITIQIQSCSPDYQMVKLFDAFDENEKGVLKDVEASVRIIVTETQHSPYKRNYGDLLKFCKHVPTKIRIIKTTNNRNASFFVRDPFFGHPTALVPQLNKNKTKRKPGDVWDSKKWNIADTNEAFILDATFLAEIGLEPMSEFELTFEVLPAVSLPAVLKRTPRISDLPTKEIYAKHRAFQREVEIIEKRLRNIKIRAKKAKSEHLKMDFQALEQCYNKALSELLKIKI